MAVQNSHKVNVGSSWACRLDSSLLVSPSECRSDADPCISNLQEAGEGNQKARVLTHHESQTQPWTLSLTDAPLLKAGCV